LDYGHIKSVYKEVISEIINKKMIGYLNVLLYKIDLQEFHEYLIAVIIKSNLINENLLDKTKFIHEADLCFKCAIFYKNFDLMQYFILHISKVTYIHIQCALKTNLVFELILKLFTAVFPQLTDKEKFLILYDSLSYSNTELRNYILNKVDYYKNSEIGWVNVFGLVSTNVQTSKDSFIHIDNFKYLMYKIRSELGNVSVVYSFLRTILKAVLKQKFDIAKLFIDQYKLEDFYFKQIDVLFDNENIYEYNKESVMYYIFTFPHNYIPDNYLTPSDIIYLIDKGFDKTRLKNLELKSTNAFEFAENYTNIKSKSCDELLSLSQRNIVTIVINSCFK